MPNATSCAARPGNDAIAGTNTRSKWGTSSRSSITPRRIITTGTGLAANRPSTNGETMRPSSRSLLAPTTTAP